MQFCMLGSVCHANLVGRLIMVISCTRVSISSFFFRKSWEKFPKRISVSGNFSQFSNYGPHLLHEYILKPFRLEEK